MNIELTISTQNLGDTNTADDNQRYATAVQTQLQSEYPEATISVELVANDTASTCRVSDDPTGEIRDTINLIANQVWDEASY